MEDERQRSEIICRDQEGSNVRPKPGGKLTFHFFAPTQPSFCGEAARHFEIRALGDRANSLIRALSGGMSVVGLAIFHG